MCDARDGSNSDVLVEELGSGEICEDFTVVNAIVVVILALLEAIELSADDSVHGIEHSDEILWLLLEELVFGQSAELLIAASGPVLNLIVDDVNLLESLLNIGVVAVHCGQLLV